ncbi:hypothetical protein OIU76_023758 [Salix suchowensis]|nr:hypothetical protein OIU76_023758 [Salix suchowensis]
MDGDGSFGDECRISNELGAAHPRTAKFALVVAVSSSFIIGLILAAILLIFRKSYPTLFSSDVKVQKLVEELTPLLALCIVIDNVQPVLSGNIGCYYIFGIPLGLILGYKVGLGVKGIWYGMLSGTVVQTLILFWIIYRTYCRGQNKKMGRGHRCQRKQP